MHERALDKSQESTFGVVGSVHRCVAFQSKMSYFCSASTIEEEHIRYSVMLIMLAFFVTSIAFSQSEPTLDVGQMAPDFSLQYATRDSITREPLQLSKVIGKRNIILAFFPADWSGGCTKEMCTMRDDFNDLEKLNAELLAVSGDYVFTHHAWAKAQNFPFRLLSDHFHKVAEMYESYNPKSGFNKRTVFVIDRQGRIAYEDLQYSVADNDDFNRLKDALAKLQ